MCLCHAGSAAQWKYASAESAYGGGRASQAAGSVKGAIGAIEMIGLAFALKAEVTCLISDLNLRATFIFFAITAVQGGSGGACPQSSGWKPPAR